MLMQQTCGSTFRVSDGSYSLRGGPLLARRPPNHQRLRVETRPITRRLRILPLRRRHYLSLRHVSPPPIPHPPHPPLRRPPNRLRRPQRRPLPPLPRHGRRLHTRRHPPNPAGKPHLGRMLPRRHHRPPRPDFLLGPRVLPLQDSGVRRHAADPPQRVPHAPPLLPPRVPPRGGGGDVLRVACGAAVSVPGGSRDQRRRSRGDVRLLPAVGARVPAAVEEGGDGLSDHAVSVRVPGFGPDALPPLYWAGLLGDLGLGLQHSVYDYAFGVVR